MVTQDALLKSDSALHTEASELLFGKGLLQVLGDYGEPLVVGSYSLRTMVWRDLDLYLRGDDISETAFFELGGRIASTLRPTRMSFRDTRAVPVEGLPPGLYWGVYLDHRSEEAWKIDIWALDSQQCDRLVQLQDGLHERITQAARLTILRIKSEVRRDPEYRHSFTALDVYRAVLDDCVEDVGSFREYLSARGTSP